MWTRNIENCIEAINEICLDDTIKFEANKFFDNLKDVIVSEWNLHAYIDEDGDLFIECIKSNHTRMTFSFNKNDIKKSFWMIMYKDDYETVSRNGDIFTEHYQRLLKDVEDFFVK